MVGSGGLIIVRLMAGNTTGWYIHISGRMTRDALVPDGKMCTGKRELRRIVVECRWFPSGICCVALCTIRGKSVGCMIRARRVIIISLMAGIAIRRRIYISACMTRAALGCYGEMCAGKRESGRIMIKCSGCPTEIGVVTERAIRREIVRHMIWIGCI